MMNLFLNSATGMRRKLMLSTFVTFLLLAVSIVVLVLALAFSPAESGGKKHDPIEYTILPTESNSLYTDGSLLLVNPTHPIKYYPENEKLLDVIGQNKHNSYAVAMTYKLKAEALTALNSMMDTYLAETGKPKTDIKMTDGYRSAADQEDKAMPVGASDHHVGLSVALRPENGAALPSDHWIYQNAHRFGFIQRYPSGKEDLTGDTSEYLYGFRYVGVAHATYIYEKGICLEEYIALLKNHTKDGEHLTLTAGGADYAIYYVPANLQNEPTSTDGSGNAEPTITSIPVPSNYSYEISGNQIDGFIVTVTLS